MEVQDYFFLVQYSNIYGEPSANRGIKNDCLYKDYRSLLVDLTASQKEVLHRVTIGFEVASVIFIAVTIFFLRKAHSKKKALLFPAKNLLLDWNQTYCILSLQMVKLIEIALWVNIPRTLYFMVILALPDQTVQWWYLQKEGFPDCVHGSYGFYIHYLFWDLMFLMMEGVFLLQGFEWIAMRFLISSQLDQTVEQIVEHQNPQQVRLKKESKLSSDEGASWFASLTERPQESFHRQELRLLRAMQVFSFVFVVAYAFFLNSLFFVGEGTRLLLLECVSFFTMVFQTVTLGRLVRPMSQFHKFEYLLHRKTLFGQWALAIFIQLNYLAFIEFDPSAYEVAFFLFQLPLFLIALLFFFIKSSQDVLQGVSKLDYLLKVSIFQKYKETPVAMRQGTIDSERGPTPDRPSSLNSDKGFSEHISTVVKSDIS